MKIIPIALAALTALSTASASWEETYDALLQKYVQGAGVDYAGWHKNGADRKALTGITGAIAAENLSGKSKDEKLAFYINAYNANILDKILDEYPTDGPGGGGYFGRNKFFKKLDFQVAGKTTNFSALENEIIRPTFNEPRIHFAINCASDSCPKLHDRAFTAENLDGLLTELTKHFVNDDPDGVTVKGGTAYISKIFDWYAEDFKAAGGAKSYINQYRDTPITGDVKFQSYKWTLNAAQ